jgi:hypothetical protein
VVAVEVAAVEEAEAAAVVAVEEDVGDEPTVHEENTNEIKTKYYDFVESFRDRLCNR